MDTLWGADFRMRLEKLLKKCETLVSIRNQECTEIYFGKAGDFPDSESYRVTGIDSGFRNGFSFVVIQVKDIAPAEQKIFSDNPRSVKITKEEAKELGVNPRHNPAVLIARFLKKIENLEKFEKDLEKGYKNGN